MTRQFPKTRKSQTRNTIKKYIFICEGHETENIYLKCLSNFIGSNNIRLIILQYIESANSHPKHLINKAQECLEILSQQSDYQSYSNIITVKKGTV